MPKQASTGKIFLYHIMTLGLYFFYWCSRSRKEINKSARQDLVPSTWQLVIPGLNYWWAWHYAQALEHVSFKRIKYADIFLLFVLATLGPGSLLYIASYVPWEDIPDQTAAATALAIVFLVFFVFLILGLAFFCFMVQEKIDAARLQKQR